MNNNDKLKKYIRTHSDEALDIHGITRTMVRNAGQVQLEDWVRQLGGDPAEILTAPQPVTNATNADGDLQDKLRAVQDILGGAGVDSEKVEEIVRDVLDADVLPSIDQLKDDIKDIAPVADTLKEIADIMKGGTNSRLPVATGVVSGKNPILKVIAPYYTAGDATETMVIVSAPPSYGKSYSINILGQSYDECFIHGCSDDVDEWSDLQGECKVKTEGGFIISDGKLVQAMRSASEGKKTLFFMDEIYRLSPKVAEKLLDFLAPQKDKNGVVKYRLTTKQNKNGVLEVLEADIDKLHIIGATNLSEVSPIEAFQDRFLIKHIQYKKETIQGISEDVADAYSISDSVALAERFAEAMGASRVMFGQGQIQKPLSIRDLKRSCMHSKDATAESVLEWMREEALDAPLMWNSDTGDIVEDSQQGVDDLKSILKL
jgi:MoxR-like ATPase